MLAHPALLWESRLRQLLQLRATWPTSRDVLRWDSTIRVLTFLLRHYGTVGTPPDFLVPGPPLDAWYVPLPGASRVPRLAEHFEPPLRAIAGAVEPVRAARMERMRAEEAERAAATGRRETRRVERAMRAELLLWSRPQILLIITGASGGAAEVLGDNLTHAGVATEAQAEIRRGLAGRWAAVAMPVAQAREVVPALRAAGVLVQLSRCPLWLVPLLRWGNLSVPLPPLTWSRLLKVHGMRVSAGASWVFIAVAGLLAAAVLLVFAWWVSMPF